MVEAIERLGLGTAIWPFYFANLIYFAGCFTALNFLCRAARTTGRWRTTWLLASTLVFGWGLWATEFVGMLTFNLIVPTTYPLLPTALAIIVATFGAWPAFALLLAVDGRRGRVVSGVLLGSTAVAVHFLGLAAVRLPNGATLLFEPGRTIVVMVAGVLLTAVAMQFARTERTSQRLAGAAALTVALFGLQVPTGAVFTIAEGSTVLGVTFALPPQWLGLAAVVNTVLILLVSHICLILDQRAARRAAGEAERLHELTDIAFEGIAIVNDEIVIEANPSLCRLLGRARARLVGRHVLDLVAPESAEVVRAYLAAPGPTFPQTELLLLGREDERISVDVLSRVINYRREKARVIAVRDNTARKQGEDRIRHLGNHDPLTGLANRSLFNDRLGNALAIAARAGGVVAMLCLDLDGFKLVNDRFGHQAGDDLLLQVAARLRQQVRALDTVARVGGDEFAIIQPLAKGALAVEALARRLVDAIAKPFRVEDHEVVIAVSVGIALYPADGIDAEALLKNADMALYRAKRTAPGSYSFFEPALGVTLRDRRILTQDLRTAIGTNQLSVHYQPMFDCTTATVQGFEALLRWAHPERGAVSPGEFIPLAEEAGLIERLGLWVLEAACTQAVDWPRRWRIAVNLSPDQFRDVDFPAVVAAILDRTGLSAERLELEVTEGLLIADTARALAALTALKAMGISVSLDDFGTGFSSLSYLRRFRFNRIKIDQSFIRELGQDDEALMIVRAIVALGGSLGLAVTAEGVETRAQLDLLREIGCGEVQGFLLGRPEPSPSTRTFSTDDWSWASGATPEIAKPAVATVPAEALPAATS